MSVVEEEPVLPAGARRVVALRSVPLPTGVELVLAARPDGTALRCVSGDRPALVTLWLRLGESLGVDRARLMSALGEQLADGWDRLAEAVTAPGLASPPAGTARSDHPAAQGAADRVTEAEAAAAWTHVEWQLHMARCGISMQLAMSRLWARCERAGLGNVDSLTSATDPRVARLLLDVCAEARQ